MMWGVAEWAGQRHNFGGVKGILVNKWVGGSNLNAL